MKPRPIRVEGDVAYVPLTRGYEAVIDAVDAPIVADRNWYALVSRHGDGSVRSVYAANFSKICGDRNCILMHRLISGVLDGEDTDHRDSDGLNNRRANLRAATKGQNACNQRRPKNNTSGFKGVTRNRRTGKWVAQIQVNGRNKNLGSFVCAAVAAIEYARASHKWHGDFGRIS